MYDKVEVSAIIRDGLKILFYLNDYSSKCLISYFIKTSPSYQDVIITKVYNLLTIHLDIFSEFDF